MSIAERLTAIIVEQLGVKPSAVVDAALFNEDLGADELDRVELVMECETAFGVSIGDAEIERIATVGDLRRLVESKL